MTARVVVVGAGPYGLSIGAFLRERGADARVFGRVMGSWTGHMPAGMFLKSTPSASSFGAPDAATTLDAYCAEAGIARFEEHADAVPIAEFVGYGRWYADRRAVRIDDRLVRSVERSRGGFDVELADGETVRAGAVVVASGHVIHAYTPPELLTLAGGTPGPDRAVSHSSQHDGLAELAGRRVAVVGGGQSALESAALLHEAGAEVTVLVRAPRIVWGRPDAPPSLLDKLRAPPSGIGPGWSHRLLTDAARLVRLLPARVRRSVVEHVLGPFGAWWLRERVDGVVDVRVATSIEYAEMAAAGRVHLALRGPAGGIDQLEVDHVLAATGYRVDVARIPFLHPQLVAAVRTVPGTASPRLNAASESSVPGLYFTGIAAAMTFGPVMRFVYGTHTVAPRIAAAAARAAASAAS